MFSSTLMPTLTQYNPLLTFYESHDYKLILTSASGIPLIRYDLKDNGGVLSHQRIRKTLNQHNINLDAEIKRTIIQTTINNLPFVYLTNRSDNAVSFYAILIYPEYVRGGIEHPSLKHKLSGRFTLVSDHDQVQEPMLTVHVELNPHRRPTEALAKMVRKRITESLRIRCSEYSFLEKAVNHRAQPNVVLHQKGESEYFTFGIKQKWLHKHQS
jgi:phenylacetate-CoA ligase